jgi:dCMP deaminase
MELDKWDYRWLGLAKHVSFWSKDPSTQVGAVIANGKKFLSLGYNGFPPGVEDKEEWLNDRETKYKLTTHAEVNAVLNAGTVVRGLACYLYPLYPCVHCASYLSAAGISRVVALVDERGGSGLLRRFPVEETEFVLKANNIEYKWIYATDN